MSPAPWQPAGTVYGALLNFRREYEQWQPRMHEAPYKAPPQAPVLYVKTANTWNPDGGQVALSGRFGLGLAGGGFLRWGADIQRQSETNRAGPGSLPFPPSPAYQSDAGERMRMG